nr:MAG TPA: hypothetical protein [Bacteriophage sp.]
MKHTNLVCWLFSNCYRKAFYPCFCTITVQVQRTFLPRILHPYRPIVMTLGKIIFCSISTIGSLPTRCG